jgi:cyclopropane fatty-acyl-phospholipid synthase-like methyltransferase
MYKEIQKCPISNETNRVSYLDFGLMPLVNNLNEKRDESLGCQRFPLKVNFYPSSSLSMLSVVVEPEVLFNKYCYKSGTSKPYIDHCRKMYSYLSEIVDIKEGDYVTDIGGNDGTLLCTFVEESKCKINPLNIDPCEDLAYISRRMGIPTATGMWNSTIASALTVGHKYDIITSTNVFQHTENIRDFVKGIYLSLSDDGIWCLEFPYWKKDLETNQYDQVYHEHIYYYLLTPLFNLFLQEGLEIVDVSEHSIHGGTLRIISRKFSNEVSKMPLRVQEILDEEKKFDENFYKEWSNTAYDHMLICNDFLIRLKAEGKKIAAFGAAAKGCTFLNASDIDYKTIDYIVDDTDTKQGKYMPGTGIEIVGRDKLVRDNLICDPPDYIVVLAHNFFDYICKSVRPVFKGKFIKMFPKPVIYE